MRISLRNRPGAAALGDHAVVGQEPVKASSELAPNLTGRLPALLPSSKVRPTFWRDHYWLQRALWNILTKPGLYISQMDWLTKCNFLEGD